MKTNFRYVFRINHVEPFGYLTEPIISDYNLFINVKRIDKITEVNDVVNNVELGSIFGNNSVRKIISFGEDYFEETKNEIRAVVSDFYCTLCLEEV